MSTSPLLSIIIVNFNSKDYLSQSLISIYRSQMNFDYEIIVVDNNSTDGSVEFIRENFSKVDLIHLENNVGFGQANNIAFKRAKGKYFLLLNPDTILQENTLQVMFEFMENNIEVGIAGCKILNPDGSLQLACRRAFPTPWVAFSKLFGFQSLFPKSKLFGRYNQTFLNPNQTYYVDAVSGSFMFVRKEVVEQIAGFDENFFIYGEDLDFCYRAGISGWKVAYVHSTSIIHYKGRSTRRSDIDEVRNFYKAMEIFAEKHFSRSLILFKILKSGISFRMFLAKLLFNSKFPRKKDIKICFLISSIQSLRVLTNFYFNFPNLKNISKVIWLGGDKKTPFDENIYQFRTLLEMFRFLAMNNFNVFFVLDNVIPYFKWLEKIETGHLNFEELRFAYDFPNIIIETFVRNDLNNFL